jgi:hypothetical protein
MRTNTMFGPGLLLQISSNTPAMPSTHYNLYHGRTARRPVWVMSDMKVPESHLPLCPLCPVELSEAISRRDDGGRQKGPEATRQTEAS